MLLPQSDAFKTLHARLHSVPTMALLKLEGGLGPLQDMGLPSQGSLSPNRRSKASRQASQLSDAASKDSARSHAQLVDFEQLLQKFKERQVRFLSKSNEHLAAFTSRTQGSHHACGYQRLEEHRAAVCCAWQALVSILYTVCRKPTQQKRSGAKQAATHLVRTHYICCFDFQGPCCLFTFSARLGHDVSGQGHTFKTFM